MEMFGVPMHTSKQKEPYIPGDSLRSCSADKPMSDISQKLPTKGAGSRNSSSESIFLILVRIKCFLSLHLLFDLIIDQSSD